MNTITLVKTGIDLLVSTGAGAVVGNAIRMSTPANMNLLQKVTTTVGGVVLSSMAGHAAAGFAIEQFNEVHAELKERKNSNQKTN